MGTFRKNQNGFSVAEAILILVLVGMIGGVGWYVYKSQKDTTKTLNNTTQGAGSAAKTTPKPQPKSVTPAPKKGEKSYVYDGHAFYYTPPEGWKVEETAYKTEANGQIKTGYITITSPDYKTKDDVDGLCSEIVSGRIFSIGVNSTPDSNDTTISKLLDPNNDAAKSGLIKNVKQTTMGGQKAAQYQSSPGECFFRTVTQTVTNSTDIDVSAESDDSVTTAPYLKSPFDTVYTTFVSSIRF